MKFSAEKLHSVEFPQHVVYSRAELSFDLEPDFPRGIASILFNDINLEIDSQGKVVSIWGLCPYQTWVPGVLKLPASEKAVLRVVNDFSPKQGVSVRIDRIIHPIIFDRKIGFICIYAESNPVRHLEIFDGAIVALTWSGKLSAVWLRANTEVREESFL
jgi:hypothetical protein